MWRCGQWNILASFWGHSVTASFLSQRRYACVSICRFASTPPANKVLKTAVTQRVIITKHTLFILERENYYKINDSIILTKQLRIWKHKIGLCRTLVLYSYRLVVVSFSYGRPAYIADPDIIFTRRRSFAEYWKHFVARFNDIHASGCNSAGSVRIQIKFGALRVYCL